MVHTTHGHRIPNSGKHPAPTHIVACGGILKCEDCKNEVLLYWRSLKSTDYQSYAKKLVTDYVISHLDKSDEIPAFEVYVVWFCKILQNWKVLLSTDLPDGMYYEVTYNGEKKETYVDAYKKFENRVIPD
jgi:hypothetical protein